eukprot:TRINITY_DN4079_c0_g2_i13.p1 TRINITY_DN4079_c0_g2~~TRINITY_DN4079_c0_g2_i13.p1  ORF type:complete len:232 (-),score=44.55 TRINITY_DN4079_c0_g2_i13:47-643(-)
MYISKNTLTILTTNSSTDQRTKCNMYKYQKMCQLPSILCFHLGRLFPDGKCSAHVAFNEIMDLTEFIQPAQFEQQPPETDYLFDENSPSPTSPTCPSSTFPSSSASSWSGSSPIFFQPSSYSSQPYLVQSQYASSEVKYRLCSVICHLGTAFGGHYIAFRRYQDKWFRISDESVSEVHIRDVLGSEAYLLFYERIWAK